MGRRSVYSLGFEGRYCVSLREVSEKEDTLGETEVFLESVLPRLTEADTALHSGMRPAYRPVVAQRSGNAFWGDC